MFLDKYLTMPRLSLYRPTQSNDYTFFDKTIKEMYQVGATDLYIHKYLGTNNPISDDATLPTYDSTDPTNIQDLLFLENRDRKYDNNIYRLRGHYNVQNLDFDLSQFGLFLTNDIIFITVHYNQMIDIIGRKLMVGDVFELPHLIDYHPLNDTIPVGLRRYYQITDANYASEGFSQTWFPHLWRIKCEPLVNSQEFNDILKDPINKDNYMGDWDPNTPYEPGYTVTYGGKIYTPVKPVPPGISPPNPEYWAVSDEQNLIDILSTYNKNLEINNAVIEQAKRELPKSGYDLSNLYILPTFIDNTPAPPISLVVPYNTNPTVVAAKLDVIENENYSRSSPVLRLNKNARKSYDLFNVVSLQIGVIKSTITDDGSGQVFPDLGLITSTVSDTITGPYGTADNTYATADQYVNITVTSLFMPQNSVRIPINGKLGEDVIAGLVLRATVYSENGTPTYIFPPSTRIIAVDRQANVIIVDQSSSGSIPDGTPIEISYDFTGTVSSVMDYRADCDPRFQYIARSTPRSFGYLNGYLIGDDHAPNGEPYQSGTSFPANPSIGDYFLRIDYLPQQLYRYDGAMWVHISSNVRTDTGLGFEDQSQLSGFINNDAVTMTSTGSTVPQKQSLSDVLRIKPD